jgi:hypothetical protein
MRQWLSGTQFAVNTLLAHFHEYNASVEGTWVRHRHVVILTVTSLLQTQIDSIFNIYPAFIRRWEI